MSLQRNAAILILWGFGFLILGFVVGPTDVSQALDVESALQGIREQQGAFHLQQQAFT